MIIQYYHSEGNISPGVYIKDFSSYKQEEELLLLPFTFFRLNNVIENEYNRSTLEMEIINTKNYIEYELKEDKIFNLEDLENNSKRPLFIKEGKNYFQNTNQINPPVQQRGGIFYNLFGRWFF